MRDQEKKVMAKAPASADSEPRELSSEPRKQEGIPLSSEPQEQGGIYPSPSEPQRQGEAFPGQERLASEQERQWEKLREEPKFAIAADPKTKMILFRFTTPVRLMGLTPDVARKLAETLLAKAEELE